MSRRGWCQHYNGVFGPGLVKRLTCRAGVAYDSLGIYDKTNFPCVGTGDSCPKREPYTESQLAEQDATLNRFLDRLRSGKCPQCDSPIEPSTVVGRCRYAACGHRVGQV